MPAPLANVPEGIVWGRVTAYVTSFVADGGTELPDGTPDATPLDGTITLTPTVGVMVFPTLTTPQQAVIQSLVCPVIGGVLYAPGTTPENVGDRDPGVVLVASEQPLGLPDRVQYNVTWALKGARVSPPPVTIDVPSQATVDLATVIPAKPGPGTVIAVSTVDRERAEAAATAAEGSAGRAFDDAAIAQGARLDAEAARDAAEAAAGTAETAATVVVTAKTLAEGFAGEAETARDQAVSARSETTTARDETVTARNQAVTARNQAVTAREDAEATSNQAVTARNEAVTAKTLAEGFAGEAETARTNTLAAAVYELRGEGQPGSSAATNDALPGTYYTDTAGTAGAWRWFKTAAGTGVSRWHVVYGDTGWRVITDLLQNGWAIVTVGIRVRRLGTQVFYLFPGVGLTGKDATMSRFLEMPRGFRLFTGGNYGLLGWVESAGTATKISKDFNFMSSSARSVVEGLVVGVTSDPWPSVLPGTPG